MYYTLDGSCPAEPRLLTREIARRTGLADYPPQISRLPAPRGVTGGDGFILADLSFVGRLRDIAPHTVAFKVGEGYLVSSLQEMGESMLLSDASVIDAGHPIFRIPSWGQRTYFTAEVAHLVGEYAPVRVAGDLVQPRRWRRPT